MLDPRASEPLDRSGQSRVGEHGVGARHEATRVGQRTPSLSAAGNMAETDGNRTRQAEILGFTGFEDREGHQAPIRLRVLTVPFDSMTVRLTQYAHGGGCACKIPPGELEEVVAGLAGQPVGELLVGLDDGDDAAVVAIGDDRAVISTADFFTPVVDDAYDWGRIAAANALSDVYAMGGRPVVAINLVGWPRDVLPARAAARGAARRARRRDAGRLPGRRRAQHRRPGAEVRHGGHRRSPTRTGCCATTPPSPGCR